MAGGTKPVPVRNLADALNDKGNLDRINRIRMILKRN
jgi:hypothetical protein